MLLWSANCVQWIARHRFSMKTVQFITQFQNNSSSSALFCGVQSLVDRHEVQHSYTKRDCPSINSIQDEKVKKTCENNCKKCQLLEIIFHFSRWEIVWTHIWFINITKIFHCKCNNNHSVDLNINYVHFLEQKMNEGEKYR